MVAVLAPSALGALPSASCGARAQSTPASTVWQSALQPSPSVVLPSSHVSLISPRSVAAALQRLVLRRR